MLHVTNGDSARLGLEATGIGGRVLAWRDALHDGPVPSGLDAAGLRAVRARFLADCGWGHESALAAELEERDAALEEALAKGEEVVLWFEHDLYDQLQLLQVLDRTGDDVLLVQAEEFLGPMAPGQLERLWPTRAPVTAGQAALARRAWEALRSPDPGAVPRLIARDDLEALPFLAAALERLLEERPGPDGLVRSERAALRALAEGPATAPQVFRATQAAEEAPFLGDTWLFRRLADLGAGPRPLLAASDGSDLPPPPPMPGSDGFTSLELRLTQDGEAVLAGRARHVARPDTDRWCGGVRVSATG